MAQSNQNTQETPKYHAFISYRHADNKEDNRHWATWLHLALETYEVPSELVGTTNERGEVIPARIYPIFRDEEELPADADLGGAITRALDDTNILVVLCSPQAVQSTYVADEIDYFKRLGRSNRIIALIIDGEPNTSIDAAKQESGFTAADECFPTPLQFEYDDNGPTTSRAEPIAADLRITDNGKTYQGWTNPESYRATLNAQTNLDTAEIDERVALYVKQHKLMLLKIVAGIIGVPLGELTRRDKAYQIALEQERSKKLRRWLTAVGLLAILAIATGVFAVLKQQEAVASQKEAEASQKKAEQRFLAQMEAEAERLTNDATKYLNDNNSAAAINALLKALPSDINKPEWPIKANTQAALNRAVQMHRESVVFTGPNDEIKRLALVGTNNVALINDRNVYLYTRAGQLIRHIAFEQNLHIGFNSDKTLLIAAGFISREETSANGSGDTVYPSYFVAYQLDANSGKTLSHIEQKAPSSGYRSLYSNGTSLFSNNGEMYVAQRSDYRNDEAQHYAVVFSTRSGKQLRQHNVNSTIKAARFSANDGLVVEYGTSSDGNSYNKSLAYFKNETNPANILFSTNTPPLCEQGKVLSAASGSPQQNQGYLITALSEDGQHLLALMPNNADYYASRCLITWNLTTGSQTPIITFSRQTAAALTPAAKQTLALTYQSSPLLVLPKNNSLKILANHRGSNIHNYYRSNGGYHVYAKADGNTIQLHHRNEDAILGSGGKVTAVHIDKATKTLWYASLDGGIRAWKIGDGGEHYKSGLSDITDLHIGSKYTVATHREYGDSWPKRFSFAAMNKQNQRFQSPHNIAIKQPFEHVDSKLYGSEHLGVLLNYNDGLYNGNSQSQRQLQLYSLADGSLSATFEHREAAYDFPPTNGVSTAYIDKGEVNLLTLSNGHKQLITLPEGYHPNTVNFIGDELIISAYDNNMDAPELRHISIFSVNTQPLEAPVKIIEKQAQSLQIKASSRNKALLLTWDIYNYAKPDELMALSANGTINNITKAWDEKYGLQYLLSDHGNRLFVISDREHIRQYAFNGTLLATTFSDQSWFEPRLGLSEDYVIDKDSFAPLVTAKHCAKLTLNNNDANVTDDNNGLLLAAADYDAIRLYDLQACTALLDIPYNSEHMRIDNNTLWLTKDNVVYRKAIKYSFVENYKTAAAINNKQLSTEAR